MTAPAFSAVSWNIRTGLPFRAVRAARGITACAGFLLLPIGKVAAAPAGGVRPAVTLTQRGVNELAAALDNARRIIVDDTGLRRPGETLPAYLARTADQLPGEENAAYQARITRFLNALQEATTATAVARRLPNLRDQSPANQLLWRHIVQALSYLPKRMQETEAAWRTWRLNETGDSKGALQKAQPGVKHSLASAGRLAEGLPDGYFNARQCSQAFSAQLTQTVVLVVDAFQGLRDAYP